MKNIDNLIINSPYEEPPQCSRLGQAQRTQHISFNYDGRNEGENRRKNKGDRLNSVRHGV